MLSLLVIPSVAFSYIGQPYPACPQVCANPITNAQTGYGNPVKYTGSGTIQEVYSEVKALPSASNVGQFFAPWVNSGNVTSVCNSSPQIMQVGVAIGGFVKSSTVYYPYYVYNNSCLINLMSNPSSSSVGDHVALSIYISGGNAWFQVDDLTNGALTYTTVTGTSDWSYNEFQTMAEAQCEGCSIGSLTYENSFLTTPSGSNMYITTGSSSLTGVSPYGSACATSSYSGLSTWTNSPSYGYSEPGFTTEGTCAYAVTSDGFTGSGSVPNVGYIPGGPDGNSANLHAANSGDSSYAVLTFGTQITTGATLWIDGYSYNNGNGAYYCTIDVYYSADGSTWYSFTGNPYHLKPSSTNTPSWIQIGKTSSIKAVYVKVVAIDGTQSSGNSTSFYVDAMAFA
jgi:hypothetical protein